MNILEMIKEGLRIARTSKSLWLYGFFVGLGTAVNRGNNNYVPGAPPVTHIAPHAFGGGTALPGIALLVVIAVGIFLYFVSQGALIEGVARVLRARPPTVGEGWRDGLAHWGVLLRIALIYILMSVGSLVALAAPVALAMKVSGTALAVTLAIPAVLIAVPWLATLYMWQQFAARIAVIENRRARDAIGKARLFLHGRLLHGLKLIIAATCGRLFVVLVGVIGFGVAALGVLGVQKAFGLTYTAIPVIALGATVLLPILFILIAVSGTTQSSIWTIGYLRPEQK